MDLSRKLIGYVEKFTDSTRAEEAYLPTCTDGIMNGDETGVDCGGYVCPVCHIGMLEKKNRLCMRK